MIRKHRRPTHTHTTPAHSTHRLPSLTVIKEVDTFLGPLLTTFPAFLPVPHTPAGTVSTPPLSLTTSLFTYTHRTCCVGGPVCGHGVEMMIHRAPNVEVESGGSTRGVECDLRCMSWWRGFMGLLVEYTGRLITLYLWKSRSLLYTTCTRSSHEF